MTDALYLRWTVTHDPSIRTAMAKLVATAQTYPAPCSRAACPWWSDTPAWDAVTLMREYEVLGGDRRALARAEQAFRYSSQSQSFTRGACPEIPYQQPPASRSPVKTLETDANVIKASLLLYGATRDAAYLNFARVRYAADRRIYLDPQVPLYTVQVVDDGRACSQMPHLFFASVNGDMIWDGLALWRATGEQHYRDEAVATASAVNQNLSDARGVFVDIQGANDVVEPLVEAMFDLGTNEHLAFASDWIVRNARAALSARAADGTFSRLFDGPAQRVTSAWESNGGLTLEIAAAALDPDGIARDDSTWQAGRVVGVPLTTLPATIVVDGSGIALIGTIGQAAAAAHVRVFIDGVETFDRDGLWQNPSMPRGDAVLFAWRWPQPGKHTIRLEPGDPHQVGTSVMHLQSFVLAPPPSNDAVGVARAAAPVAARQ
ncbi:MAG TPA: hypothetical protein VE591_05250 [Candidatus Acidoferrum sp.]|nr:hypothetical protein [Candidatus Acidoferrum sp.]